MKNSEFDALLLRIREEVLLRLAQAEPEKRELAGTALLLDSFLPSPQNAIKKLERVCEEGDRFFINFSDRPFKLLNESVIDAKAEQVWRLSERISTANALVLLAPRIGLLSNITKGNDENLLEQLIIRALLWRKKITVLLDFELPKSRGNIFFEKLVSIIETLEDMGISILSYPCGEEQKAEKSSFVTEEKVMEAFKQRQKEIACSSRAIVTPLAKDKARELGIHIEY